MFTFKRNQIIITVLVFMIAIAAYLNTKDQEMGVQPNLVQDKGGTQEVIAEEKDFFEGYDEIETLPPDMETDLSEAMNTEVSQKVESASENNTPKVQKIEAVITKKDSTLTGNDYAAAAVDKNMDVSYFVEEKMLREQNRALQIEELTQYVANENLDKEAKSKAAENLLAIQERIEKESSAEALLRAKGFREVYVRIDDNSVDVVINKENLTDSDIAQIEEIVNRKTGYSVGKIKITPLKGIVKEGTN